VNRVPAGNRGAALGAYSAFLDLSLGITGPVAGLIVTGFSYPAIFLFAALSAVVAMAIALALQRTLRGQSAQLVTAAQSVQSTQPTQATQATQAIRPAQAACAIPAGGD
jgi:MFS family permease